MAEQFDITIVYGTNKKLAVSDTETIGGVKVRAMGEFGIPAGEAGQYVLRAKVDGKDQQLQEQQTVEQAELRKHEKVTLASGTPYGCG